MAEENRILGGAVTPAAGSALPPYVLLDDGVQVELRLDG
jgi:hypothetical protein